MPPTFLQARSSGIPIAAETGPGIQESLGNFPYALLGRSDGQIGRYYDPACYWNQFFYDGIGSACKEVPR